jgi:hypothetical protein
MPEQESLCQALGQDSDGMWGVCVQHWEAAVARLTGRAESA